MPFSVMYCSTRGLDLSTTLDRREFVNALQEVAVTDPDGHIPRSLASSLASSPSSQPPAPKIAAEFANYFNQSRYALLDRQDVDQYKDGNGRKSKAK
ncbi:hypothetical protein K435DRAFT_851475 [Dendrothele bispora CBS 962.96]|uniref:Uncharacterized protein n=1 Tax=Dendrothele bispora (strain CBS 962.96) TaxID=1314807 RepID=A0A4V4HHS6_DENBC|nr:hypothetical protein K435DRAFT_851475 [Dendrothele bispora CBS 962.96]